MSFAVAGSAFQLIPWKRFWETFWPAPKQSKTVRPRKPRGRRLSWMVQEKSEARFLQGVPAGLSMAKSVVREKPSAVQQSAKQLAQSGRSDSRSRAGVEGAAESLEMKGM